MRSFRFHALAAASLLALTGCFSHSSQTVRPVTPAAPSTFNQAQALAQAGAQANAAQIKALLLATGTQELQRMATAMSASDPLYPYAAQELQQRGSAPPYAVATAHITAARLDQRAPAHGDGYRPPQKLAVLLPLSGNMATAAKPVRDGLMAAYYAENRNKPAITFYDTRNGAVAAYREAVAAGNDYVIGPLNREETDQLFAQPSLPVPVLALNRGNTPPPPGSLSFSLSPEDEGIAAAEFLIHQRVQQALVVQAADDDTMRRAAHAFAERFAARGGKLVANVSVSRQNAGLDTALAALQGQSAGAVYLATRGEQARHALPVIAAHPATARAIRLGVSQLNNDSNLATQLEGIVFPGENLRAHHLPGDISTISPSARGAAARLFAFGHDAWLISNYQERMASNREGGIRGVTGRLQLDAFGNIVRHPEWLMLRGGVAMPLTGQ